MVGVFLHPGSPPALAARLRALGCQIIPGELALLAAGCGQAPGRVVVVPEAGLSEPAWARWRVDLNRASHQFVVVLTRPEVAATVRAMKEGAFEVVCLDDPPRRWQEALIGAAQAEELWNQLYGAAPLTSGEVLVGGSDALRDLRQTIRKLGPTDVTVLIHGESGVGKECVAEALHRASRRQGLVSLNCAAIPRDLMESELFGAEKGAFTGAVRSRPGVFEQAAGGTLFLDEIGEMDLSVQPKLLRVLESRQARRVGGEAPYPVTARIVTATNRDLQVEIAAGRFRLDLYYRIAEMTVPVPPLRTRPADIPALALRFLAGANERFGKNIQGLEPGLIRKFESHSWPGNVRELKSAIDRLVLLFDGPTLRESWWEPTPAPAPLPPFPTPPAAPAPPAVLPTATQRPGDSPSPREETAASAAPDGGVPGGAAPLPRRAEKLALARKLLASGEPPGRVAAQLGIDASTLFRWRRSGKL